MFEISKLFAKQQRQKPSLSKRRQERATWNLQTADEEFPAGPCSLNFRYGVFERIMGWWEWRSTRPNSSTLCLFLSDWPIPMIPISLLKIMKRWQRTKNEQTKNSFQCFIRREFPMLSLSLLSPSVILPLRLVQLKMQTVQDVECTLTVGHTGGFVLMRLNYFATLRFISRHLL